MKKIIELLVVLGLLAIFAFLLKNKLAISYHNRASDYYARAQYQEAITYFKRSLKLDPSLAAAHSGLANAYLELKLTDKAIEEYRKVVRYDPHSIGGYQGLIDAYLIQGRDDSVFNLLEEAKVMVSDRQEINNLLDDVSYEFMAAGIAAFRSDDKPRGYDLLNKALSIKPDFAIGYYNLAYLYYLENNYNEAEAALNRLLRVDPAFWAAYKFLGDISYDKGAYEEAVDKYKKALSLRADDAVLHNDLGIALMQMERYDEAIAQLKEALRLNPGDIHIRYGLASVYRDRGMPDEAVSEYKTLVLYRPDYSNVHNDLGDIYTKQKRNQEALEEYRREIEYSQRRLKDNPEDAVALNNMAYAYNGIGEYAKAKELIDRVVAMRPNYRQAYLTLAKICDKLERPNEALAALDKAKALSAETNFIERDVSLLKRRFMSVAKDGASFYTFATVYLKNGRQLRGIIKAETEDSIVLEVATGSSRGTVTLYRNSIERIVK